MISREPSGCLGKRGWFPEGALDTDTLRRQAKPTSRRQRLTLRVHEQRPVDQVQVEVVQAQILQAQVYSLLDPSVIGAPELGGDEEILSLHLARRQGFFDAVSNFLLVLVAESGIDVPVAHGNSVAHGSLDLPGAGLPGACGQVSTSVRFGRGQWFLRRTIESDSGDAYLDPRRGSRRRCSA